jgi:hypothetical protein
MSLKSKESQTPDISYHIKFDFIILYYGLVFKTRTKISNSNYLKMKNIQISVLFKLCCSSLFLSTSTSHFINKEYNCDSNIIL